MLRLQSISNTGKRQGQGLVEFALILPVLLLMIMGIIDFGRALFTYGQASSQLREALRQAAAIGLPGGGIPPYRDCPNMQALATKVYFARSITNFTIQYARTSGTKEAEFKGTPGDFTGVGFDTCSYNLAGNGSGTYGPVDLANGDILRISETVSIDLLTPFVPTRTLTFQLQGQRTVITGIDVATDYCGDLICSSNEGDPTDPINWCMVDCSRPDLHLSIDGPTSALVNTVLKYNITVKNDRPPTYNTPAPNVKVYYQIPSSGLYSAPTCGGAPCSIVGNQVIWDLGTVPWIDTTKPPPYPYPVVTLQIMPNLPSVLPPLQVVATVSTTGADPNPSTSFTTCDPNYNGYNNVACFPTTVTSIPGDIYVSANSDAPSSGLDFDKNITYTIVGYKDGGSTPTGVHLTLSGIPSGFIFVSADPGVSYNKAAGTADWALGTPSSYPVVKRITFQAHQDGTFNSKGTITWDAGSFIDIDNPTPGNPGNNESAFSYIVNPPSADLSIRKQLTSPATTTLGMNVNYSLTITNNSTTVVAAAPTVVDTFPDDPGNPWAAVAYQSYVVSPKGSVTKFTLTGSHNTTATWTLANLAPGATVTINIVAATQSVGTWTNAVAVSSDTTDNNPGNNTDRVAVTTNILAPVTGLKPWGLRCTGLATRRYMGLTWNRVPGADGYYILADGVLIGQTTDGVGNINSCGGSVSRSRPRVVSGCYNLNPNAWKAGSSVNYTVEAFINIGGGLVNIGPASFPLAIKC